MFLVIKAQSEYFCGLMCNWSSDTLTSVGFFLNVIIFPTSAGLERCVCAGLLRGGRCLSVSLDPGANGVGEVHWFLWLNWAVMETQSSPLTTLSHFPGDWRRDKTHTHTFFHIFISSSSSAPHDSFTPECGEITRHYIFNEVNFNWSYFMF